MNDSNRRASGTRVSSASAEIERGRKFYGQRAWLAAYTSLLLADGLSPLDCEDLELLATCAYLVGRDDDYAKALERAHQGHQDAGEGRRAVRCAFWVGLHHAFRGEMGPASGWFGRAQRLLELEEQDCVERGYMQLPAAEMHLGGGNFEAAFAAADAAAEAGGKFGDKDLVTIARHLQGKALIQQKQVEGGLALLDEAMVAVTVGEASPIVTGLIYCSVIEMCLDVYDVGRAREWTSALVQWCEEQPELVAFTGRCLRHRSEIMQMQGIWTEALQEARRARERIVQGNDRETASAFYQQAEIHRLRGSFTAAEEAYRSANELGREPQPGLALMRLSQGRADTAAASMRSVMSAASQPLQRAKLLPACIEIMLAIGEIQESRGACQELEEIAASHDTAMLNAMAAHARGSVELAEGAFQAALASLGRASQMWNDLEAPYEAARVRVLIGLACRALGDDEGAALAMDAARATLEQLGAGPAVAHVDSLKDRPSSARSHGLTARELEVLRGVAAGKTNKVIASELYVSAKTIDRHLSNIFTKLDVPSRAAATAYVLNHQLI